MNLINLTPHAIKIQCDQASLTIAPSGTVARVKVSTMPRDPVMGTFPLSSSIMGPVEDLPSPQEGIVYIVSGMVAQHPHMKDRMDVVAPDSGPTAIRNEQGQIIAVRGFVRYD